MIWSVKICIEIFLWMVLNLRKSWKFRPAKYKRYIVYSILSTTVYSTRQNEVRILDLKSGPSPSVLEWNRADFDVQVQIRSGRSPLARGIGFDRHHTCWYSSRVYSLPIQVQCFSSNFGLQQHARLWASRAVSETMSFYSNDGLGECLQTSKAMMNFSSYNELREWLQTLRTTIDLGSDDGHRKQ